MEESKSNDSNSGSDDEINKEGVTEDIADLDLSNIEFVIDNSNLDPLSSADEISGRDMVLKFLDSGEVNFYYGQKDTAFDDAGPSGEGEVKEFKERKRKRRRRVVTKLPTALKGLMGEANLRCARGDKETGVKICLEIIRQVPTAAEPFQTLAGIYDEMGDKEKSLQMSLVAAHLSPTDVYGWIHLGNCSEDLGNIRQAIKCFTKAINLDIQNMDLHKKRTALLEKIGDKKTAIKGYLKLLYSLTPKQGEYVVSVANFVAEMCHKENDLENACGALEVATAKCPQLITMDFVNVHLEILISLKNYKRCLEILVAFCDFVIEADTSDSSVEQEYFEVIDCSLPPNVPVDILSKAAVVLIHLKAFHLIQKIISPILEMEVSDVGELYLDVADAYVEENLYFEASSIYSLLVRCPTFSLPGVWLKYADSLKRIDKIEEAIYAYYNVLEGAQQHTDVKLTLASLLVGLNRIPEAINVLTQGEDEIIETELLYERCRLMKGDKSRLNDFLKSVYILMLRHSIKLHSKDEIRAISVNSRSDRKRVIIKQIRNLSKDSDLLADIPEFKKFGNVPSLQDEWDLFKHACNLCMKHKFYGQFHRFALTAQLSSLFVPFKYEIDLLAIISSYYNGDYYYAFNLIRLLLPKYIDDSKMWTLFHLIVTRSEDTRHHRFVMRLLTRFPEHSALGISHGNNSLVSGTYKYALHEYNSLYLKNPTDLCALLMAITFIQVTGQKYTRSKTTLITQAMGFFQQYKKDRGSVCMQEVYYNIGRALQHLGLYSSAILHYQQALECPPNELALSSPHLFNIQREAAFNLHLIYLQSDSHDLASYYLNKYIIV